MTKEHQQEGKERCRKLWWELPCFWYRDSDVETGGRTGGSRKDDVEVLFGNDVDGLDQEQFRGTIHLKCFRDKCREAE